MSATEVTRRRLLGGRATVVNARVQLARWRPRPPLVFPEHAERTTARCIIVSKDRAMQLDACLRSAEQNAPFTGEIFVVYKATTPEFEEGYQLLAQSTRARLLPERDFRSDVMDLIDPTVSNTVFLMDDNLCFRRPSGQVSPGDQVAAVNLRLGLNTTYCYALDRDQPIPNLVSDGDLIAWDWRSASDDFSYPMSIDGSIFNTRLLLRMLARARFRNPNELEEELHLRRHLAPPWLVSFRQSSVVGIPVNLVNATHHNRAGTDPSLAPAALNARFLAGERIALDAMEFSDVRGAHQEIPIVFERRERLA
jgi:hypothetical protein